MDSNAFLTTAITANQQIETLLSQMLNIAIDASCGTRTAKDRQNLQQKMLRVRQSLELVADLTAYDLTPLLRGVDGSSGTLPLVTELVESTEVLLVPKTPHDLFGENHPSVNTWSAAVSSIDTIQNALQVVETDIAQLEETLPYS